VDIQTNTQTALGIQNMRKASGTHGDPLPHLESRLLFKIRDRVSIRVSIRITFQVNIPHSALYT